jgi:hypothetical protein
LLDSCLSGFDPKATHWARRGANVIGKTGFWGTAAVALTCSGRTQITQIVHTNAHPAEFDHPMTEETMSQQLGARGNDRD